MCGIVGYVGKQNVAKILLEGLSTLEYRGYDSAGISICENNKISSIKAVGKLDELKKLVSISDYENASSGIGHTRWATHGAPTVKNAHPHLSSSGKFSVVHNGIIENFKVLKDSLIATGVQFNSDTDTEVVAQLLEFNYNGKIFDTIVKTLKQLEGAYAFGIICADDPDTIYAVRKGSPLVVGTSDDGYYIASDVPAILKYTRDVYFLDEAEIVVANPTSLSIVDYSGNPIEKKLSHIEWDVSSAEKNGYEHFMLKEMFEQPSAFSKTVKPRIKDNNIVLDGIEFSPEYLRSLNKIFIVACGSAYYAGVCGKYMIEKYARIAVEVQLASEFRYSSPIVDKNTLIIVISQSGETADSREALLEAKRLGAKILSVVNVVGSSIARESDNVIYTWAGPEIAVATTKGYTTQLAVMSLIALYISKQLSAIDDETYTALLREYDDIPAKMLKILNNKEHIKDLSKKYVEKDNVFFIGRNIDYALSLEGALKLKEISYTNAESYPAGELKHGPISLLDETRLTIAVATYKKLLDKTISNIIEVKARGSKVLSVVTENSAKVKEVSDDFIEIPDASDIFLPVLGVIALQLFAYYIAYEKGCDIDKPKNLAKSVTVE